MVRVASLLPAATEMVHFAGGSDSLVGVTHECDYPPEARSLPRLTTSKIDSATMTSRQIDDEVHALSDSASLYSLDTELLQRLRPDLVVTQGLCEVCAVSESVVERAVSNIEPRPEVLTLNPTSLEEVMRDSLRIGEALGRGRVSSGKVATLRERLERVRGVVGGLDPVRVACVEWLDPPFSAGHWVPEMVHLAGGVDVLAAPGEPSRRLEWSEVEEAEPETLVLMPCGFDVSRTTRELPALTSLPPLALGVWAVDANSCFSRPAPRLVEGVEVLARVLHPEAFPDPPSEDRARRLPALTRDFRAGPNRL